MRESLEVSGLNFIEQVKTVDVFGTTGRVDFVIFGTYEDFPYSLAIELKGHFGISKNAAEGLHQAFHYREMSILTDPRLPSELRFKSPNIAFAGILVQGDYRHDERLFGMEILALKFGCGIVLFDHNGIELRMGEVHLLRIGNSHRYSRWHTSAGNYLFGSVKRAGSRRERMTYAEQEWSFLQ